jgi:methyltransferase (TIGR00027 family)
VTQDVVEADHTAVRVALWRALHVRADPPPHVLEDEIGLRLAGPDDGWRDRPDMDVEATRRTRASIVARTRHVEDLVVERGVEQYVVLGAGLDTFAQRRPEIAAERGLRVFEVDRPGPQTWKRQRLEELGFGVPAWLRLVPVDFEGDWWGRLAEAGFDPGRPAVVASTGVTMYLTREANEATFRLVAGLAPGVRVRDDLPTAAAGRRAGSAAATGGGGEGSAGGRHPVPQFLRARRDPGPGARIRFPGGPARPGGGAGPPVLRGPDGRRTTVQGGGADGGEHLRGPTGHGNSG